MTTTAVPAITEYATQNAASYDQATVDQFHRALTDAARFALTAPTALLDVVDYLASRVELNNADARRAMVDFLQFPGITDAERQSVHDRMATQGTESARSALQVMGVHHSTLTPRDWSTVTRHYLRARQAHTEALKSVAQDVAPLYFLNGASRSGCCDATLTKRPAAGWTCDACHGPVVVNVHA